ncbi:MAG: IS3 family transposase [Verrucomicrobia bacterium]|nr:IS3 family transposase [Verrucomicrobiota bacterium]
MSGRYKVQWLCEALLVSRSGYYDWQRRRRQPGPRAAANAALCERIHLEFVRQRRAYGSPRLARALGLPGSRHRIARLMRQNRLQARQRSKYRVATTDSRHADPIAPNRLVGFKAQRPYQAWVTDATCVLTGEGWLYVVALLDVFTRKIVGWAMGPRLDAALAVRALDMAITRCGGRPGLIVHSDRGSQFTSVDYRRALAAHGCVASMSRKGNCYDNAFIESFWSSLKYEVVYPQRFPSRASARAALFDYIESFYNRIRLHSSLGYVSPLVFESKLN